MVLLVDMSESMISSLENIRNVILSMHDTILKRQDRLGLVIFKGGGATTLQRPTKNLNLVVKKLTEVGASDLTPLASGMYEAWRLLRNEKLKNKDSIPVLVVISDGITNVSLDSPLSPDSRKKYLNHSQADAIDVAYLLKRDDVRTLVINPSHHVQKSLKKFSQVIGETTDKKWLEPTDLLMEILNIVGGYYYGISENGVLNESVLIEAFSIIGN